MCNASISLWTAMKKEFLLTPLKFHYVFSLREVTWLFRGLIQVDKKFLTKPESLPVPLKTYMAQLWANESRRVFVDRMNNHEDIARANAMVDAALAHHFGLEAPQPLYFVDFIDQDEFDKEGALLRASVRKYVGEPSFAVVKQRCEEFLRAFNEEQATRKAAPIDFIMFEDAVQHITRIARVLRQSRSHVMLVGLGASGRKSQLRLACFINGTQCLEAGTHKNDADFREELKDYFRMVGQNGRELAMMVGDPVFKREDILESLSGLLSTGEVAGLFAKDEKEIIASNTRDAYMRE
jgi:dynein heavy chain